MLKVKEESVFKRKVRSFVIRILDAIENNNNPHLETNGEGQFLKDLLKIYRGQKITVFDIGANVGSYSKLLVDGFQKENIDFQLHAFEPVKSTFKILTQKLENNPKVHLNNFGISNKEEETEIYFDNESSSLASLYKREMTLQHVTLNKKEIIKLRKLEDYIDKAGMDKIHFMKIDIEGHETSAFEGFGKYLSSKFINIIQFEYGGANLDSNTTLKSLYMLLENAGFEIYKLRKGSLERRKFQPIMENFQYANYVAIAPEFFVTFKK